MRNSIAQTPIVQRAAPLATHGKARIETGIKLLCLCLLFFYHPAAMSVVGRAYYALIGLNDINAPVGPNVFLEPAIVLSILLIVWRLRRGTLVDPVFKRKYGLGVALMVSFIAATASVLANYDTPQVSLVYVSAFGSGLLVYVALSGLRLQDREVDWVFLALAIGSLLPLVAGWNTFYGLWGFPDFATVFKAQGDRPNSELYELATFGSRGNTVAFLVLILPPLFWLTLDSTKRWLWRLVWAICLSFAFLNLLILQERAGFIVALCSVGVVWRFKAGSRFGYVLLAAALVVGIFMMQTYTPAAAELIFPRFVSVLTADTSADASVAARHDAMLEGVEIARDNWLVGIGPGASIVKHSQGSAHQFNINQWLETGILGLIGSLLCCIAAALYMGRILAIGHESAVNRQRFVMSIGPTAYSLNGVISNGPLAAGYVNTWVILALAMLALAPGLMDRELAARRQSVQT